MDETDRRLLRALQDGIPIVERPFGEVAAGLGLGEDEVVARLRKLVEEGYVKRFGASLDHLKIGFRANAMIVWKVPEDRVEEVGAILACADEVTHCYERAVVPGRWEHNVFSMVHMRDREECERFAERMAGRTGVNDYKIIYSTREFKKTSAGLMD